MTVAETALAAWGRGGGNVALKSFAVFKECPEFASEMVMTHSEVICVEENEVAQIGILDL